MSLDCFRLFVFSPFSMCEVKVLFIPMHSQCSISLTTVNSYCVRAVECVNYIFSLVSLLMSRLVAVYADTLTLNISFQMMFRLFVINKGILANLRMTYWWCHWFLSFQRHCISQLYLHIVQLHEDIWLDIWRIWIWQNTRSHECWNYMLYEYSYSTTCDANEMYQE